MPRFVPYVLTAVMVGTIAVGVVIKRREARNFRTAIDTTRTAVDTIEQAILMHTAIATAEDARLARPPASIDPSWFDVERPQNSLLDLSRPWVEIAAEEDRDRLHPRLVIASHSDDAAFWYNPRHGVIRARVPRGMSDQAAIELYNEINDAGIVTPFPGR